jgi:hypothetical protein
VTTLCVTTQAPIAIPGADARCTPNQHACVCTHVLSERYHATCAGLVQMYRCASLPHNPCVCIRPLCCTLPECASDKKCGQAGLLTCSWLTCSLLVVPYGTASCYVLSFSVCESVARVSESA